jgi:hypothetical protein
MKKKEYEGNLKDVSYTKIYVNINNLKKGIYVLNITHKNKIIKQTIFNKK